MIRTLIIDIDVPDRDDGSQRWSADDLSDHLTEVHGSPVYVWGQLSSAEVDSAFRKLRQLSRETESDDTKRNRVHSAHKALSFFRDMFPTKWWDHHRPGERR